MYILYLVFNIWQASEFSTREQAHIFQEEKQWAMLNMWGRDSLLSSGWICRVVQVRHKTENTLK